MSDTLRNAINVALQLFIALSWHYKCNYGFLACCFVNTLTRTAHKQTMNMLVHIVTTRVFVAAIDRREITPMATAAKKLPGDTGSQGYRYSATECNLLVPDSPVTLICSCELMMSAIYCIAWSFFSFQLAKTCNSQKYCMSVTSQLIYWYIREVYFMASSAKGTRLPPPYFSS